MEDLYVSHSCLVNNPLFPTPCESGAFFIAVHKCLINHTSVKGSEIIPKTTNLGIGHQNKNDIEAKTMRYSIINPVLS